MTISLNKDQESRLKELIDSGQFESAEDFIDYSLASLSAEAEHEAWMKAEVQKGVTSLDKGAYSSLSTEEIAGQAERELSQANA